MATIRYLVEYVDHDDQYKRTSIQVPNYIPEYDPTDQEDVPLYIKDNIKDLCLLEHYEAAE